MRDPGWSLRSCVKFKVSDGVGLAGTALFKYRASKAPSVQRQSTAHIMTLCTSLCIRNMKSHFRMSGCTQWCHSMLFIRAFQWKDGQSIKYFLHNCFLWRLWRHTLLPQRSLHQRVWEVEWLRLFREPIYLEIVWRSLTIKTFPEVKIHFGTSADYKLAC